MENFEDLLKEYDLKTLKRGDEVTGTVVEINDTVIYLDIHSFKEGKLYLDHYTKDKTITSFKDVVKIGDEITCTVASVKGDGSDPKGKRDGEILLSRLNQVNSQNLEELIAKKDSQEVIEVKVVKDSNGKGFECVYNDVKVFMPKSQATQDVEIGKVSRVKVQDIKDNGRNKSVIVSRRVVETEEYNALRQEELDKINEGDVLKGTVCKIEKFGALVRFVNLTGLLKTSQVSHKFIDITKELTIGQEIEVKVIKKDNNKIELSRKALVEAPFQAFVKNHKVSDTVKGKLTNKLQFGLLIELAEDVKGLLHNSEYSYNPNDNFANNVKIGDEIEAVIIAIDPEKEKISLSRKPLLDNPWAKVEAKVGDKTTCKITEVNEKGLKVEAFGVDGFIPLSEALEKRDDLTKYFNVGEEVEAIVTEIKVKDWRLKLSIRKLKNNEERANFEKHLTDDAENATIGDQFKEVLEK